MAGDVISLPPLREELDLFAGPAAFDGSPTWSLYDPANQHYYRIGKQECEILSYWNLKDPEAIVLRIKEITQFDVTVDDVMALYQFLMTHNLFQLQGVEATQFLLKQARAGKQNWFSWLIHHYLFFKIPLVRPDNFLNSSYPYIRGLFQPLILYLLITLLMINLYVLVDRWALFSQTFLHFFSIQGFIYYALALSIAKVLHEMGHAYTAHHYGCRVSSMGVAFLVMFPVLYTDTSDAWKLTSKKQRMAIGAAGMLTELALAIICSSLWHFLADGPLRSSVFLMATTTWVMTLFVNLNPFMRFDGYYLLSDFLGIENLQQRAFNLGRWKLRYILFGLQEQLPEKLPDKLQRTLIIYAWGTWIYRFLLFLGIALLVYHFFFKALGVLLMFVEVIWFIALPIYKEIKHCLQSREKMNWNKNSVFTAMASLLLLVFLFIPWQTRIEAPAVLKAGKQSEIYMPFPAKLTQVLVQSGEKVDAGQLLFEFNSSTLDFKIEQMLSKVKALRWQLSFHAQQQGLNQRSQITQGELKTALSEYKSLLDERQRLFVRAPFSGVVLDINEQLSVDQWISQDELLLTVAQFEHYRIEAYVDEVYLGQLLQNSQQAVFYPEQLSWPAIDCQLVSIDNAASSQIKPAFASRYTGSIPIKRNHRQQALIPETSVYRVGLQADKKGQVINQAIRGNVMIDAPAESIAAVLWKQVLSIIIKESGF